MPLGTRLIPLDAQVTPEQVILHWPPTTPLATLFSGPGDSTGVWARWSYLAAPTDIITINPADPDPLGTMARHFGADPTPVRRDPDHPPFMGGWFVTINYDVGETIEPTTAMGAGTGSRAHTLWPWAITLLKCPWAYAHDRLHNRWWLIGPPKRAQHDPAAANPLPPISDLLRGPGASPGTHDTHNTQTPQIHTARAHTLRGPWSVEGDAYFPAAVAKAVELIRAGDIFQVNLAHRLAAEFTGSARSLFVRAIQRASPRYGAYIEVENHGQFPNTHAAHFALSLSPELFLQFDPATRTLITRPIKGTLSAEHSADALRESIKNQAELNMIIDLMRNDLGRVAEFGSIRVDEARAIETHAVATGGGDHTIHSPALHHGVGTVSCRVRPGLTITDILRATFPAGSITGAPKVRAMQIINQLHAPDHPHPPQPRGLYTGSIGYISDSGHFALNVAIRTAMILDQRDDKRRRSSPIDECDQAAVLVPVGAGIVADSDPKAEWQETLDKARVFTDLADEAPASTQAHRDEPPARPR